MNDPKSVAAKALAVAQNLSKSETHGTLCNYRTGEGIRPATRVERINSISASARDGGAGVIIVDGVACYVDDWS